MFHKAVTRDRAAEVQIAFGTTDVCRAITAG